jgi:branched-chain amino acid transport system permease protein
MSSISVALKARQGRLITAAVVAAVLIVLAIIPQVTSEYITYVVVLAMLYAVLTGSSDVLTGYTGPLTFCHGAFYGIGAYTSALLTLRAGLPFWVAFPVSGVLVFLFAVVIGYPALRLRGHYFAVTTFFFAHFVYLVILNSVGLTNGPLGLGGIKPPESFLGIDFSRLQASYYLIFIYGTIVITALLLFIRSGVGKLLVTIRENEDLSEAIGVNTSFFKVLAFSIGAGVAGLTGSMFAHFFRLLHPTTFAWMTSEMVVIMSLVGGLGTLIGPIIGAGIITLILELMRFAPELRFITWSVALIAVLMIEPKGLMGLVRRIQPFGMRKRGGGR